MHKSPYLPPHLRGLPELPGQAGCGVSGKGEDVCPSRLLADPGFGEPEVYTVEGRGGEGNGEITASRKRSQN